MTSARPNRTAEDGTAGRDRTDLQASVLVVLAFAAVVVPRLVQTATAPVKYRTSVGAQVPDTRLATLAEQGLVVLLASWCLLLVLQRVRQLPTDRRAVLVALLAPWVYLVARDIYVDRRPTLTGLLYPLVVVAVWVLRPSLRRLALVGPLVGATAVISMALGLLVPERGILTSISRELIAPDKEILPWGILVGPFANGNNLGQVLVLGLPAVLLMRSRAWACSIVAVVVLALVWTSSRSSLGAVAVGCAVALLVRLAGPARGVLAAAAMVAVGSVVALLPLTATTNDAFTNRGYIWKSSLQSWSGNPWVGLGSAWYSDIGRYANSLPGTAFHGHNQLVHTLVVGGVINLVLVLVMTLALVLSAARWAVRGTAYPATFLCMFFVSCSLEVAFGFVDRGFLLAVTVLPMAWIALSADTAWHDGEPTGTTRPALPVPVARRPTRAGQDARTTPSTLAPAASRVLTSSTNVSRDIPG